MKNIIVKAKKSIFIYSLVMIMLSLMLTPLQSQAKTAISKQNINLMVGKTATLKLTGTSKKVKWSSNKKKVATVSPTGKVKGISKGTATITAKAGNKKYNCQVLVYSANSSNKKVNKVLNSVISKNIKASMSTVEKVKVIHDYLVLNCEYDYSNYLKNSIPYVSYTPEGVLVKKRAVCQGYAETFKLFMDSLNIPCKLVTGTANGGGHAWNIVRIDGKWYQIDVTWDDPVPDEKNRVLYEYFLITDSEMSKNHSWSKSSYPKCNTSPNNLISLFGKPSHNFDEAISNTYDAYKKDKNKMTVILSSKLKEDYGIWKIISNMNEKYNITAYSYSYSYYKYGDYYIYTISIN